MIFKCDICEAEIHDITKKIDVPTYNEDGSLHYHEKMCYKCFGKLLNKKNNSLVFFWSVFLFNCENETANLLQNNVIPLIVEPSKINLLVSQDTINELNTNQFHKLHMIFTLMKLFNLVNTPNTQFDFSLK